MDYCLYKIIPIDLTIACIIKFRTHYPKSKKGNLLMSVLLSVRPSATRLYLMNRKI